MWWPIRLYMIRHWVLKHCAKVEFIRNLFPNWRVATRMDDIQDAMFPGIERWYKCGELHRLDGPAVIHWVDGKIIGQFWYVRDTEMALTEWMKHSTLPMEELVEMKLMGDFI